MSSAEVAIFRTQLENRRRRLAQAARAAAESDELTTLLQAVDCALERVEQGTFGICEECHDPIEHDRLLADPLVCLCLDHLNADQRRTLEQDLETAVRIQTSLLPAGILAGGGWEAHYHYEPSGPVSGDYCDFIQPSNGAGAVCFLTGDVSGKGVAASLLMSHLHAIFRSLLPFGLPVTELMERANRVFCESTLPMHYATLVCGRAAPSGEVELANAGHCPPVLVSMDGARLLEAGDLPLGLFCTTRFTASRLRLEPGESLVLYTDGLTEARDADDAEYGVDRLRGLVDRCRGIPAREMAETVLAHWRTFLHGARPADDVTVMVVRRGPEVQSQ